MSSSGTPQTTAPKRSGRWVSAAPTSRPPFEPPHHAQSCAGPLYLLRDQALGGGDEVVEDVLLALQASGVVPRLAVLAAAAQVAPPRYTPPASSQGTMLERKLGVWHDVEAAVAVEERRVRAVLLQVLADTTNIGTRVPSFDG